MLPQPTIDEVQDDQDCRNLRAFAVFHFIAVPFVLVGSVLAFQLYECVASHQYVVSDSVVFGTFFLGVNLLVVGVLNLLSGLFLLRRRHRNCSLVTAALNLQLPLGNILGVFTIIALSRNSVRQMYEREMFDE